LALVSFGFLVLYGHIIGYIPYVYTLWLFNIAMENGPFIDGLPIKNGWIFHGYVSHNQMVQLYTYIAGVLYGPYHFCGHEPR
jgi:hypothetical protein